MSLVIPQDLQITHISANRYSFAAYTTGRNCTVLVLTSLSFSPDLRPEIVPSLQNGNIISVSISDFHFGALTGDGRFLTWCLSGLTLDLNVNGRGTLGLGDPLRIEVGEPGGYAKLEDKKRAAKAFRQRGVIDPQPPPVTVPTEVKFIRRNSRGDRQNIFCIAATANGWHMGVLAINLDVNVPDIEGVYDAERLVLNTEESTRDTEENISLASSSVRQKKAEHYLRVILRHICDLFTW